MTTNLALILTSSALLIVVLALSYVRWSRFDLLDLFVLMSGAFFGAYTLIDALVNDLRIFDPGLAVWTHLSVAIMAGAAWVAVRFFPADLQRRLELRYLGDVWSRVRPSAIVILTGTVLVFTAFGFAKYGVISQSFATLGSAEETTMPYWFSSLRSLIPPLVLACYVAALLRFLRTGGRERLLWIVTLLVIVGVSALYGRRAIFFVVALGGLFWSFERGRNIFSGRALWVVGVMAVVLVLFSNVFTTYRLYSTGRGAGEMPPVHVAMFDFGPTVENLQRRMPMWQYNYRIIERQIESTPEVVPLGLVAIQAAENAVPKFLWAGKNYTELDGYIAWLYTFQVTDYPSNLFAVVQSDFGALALLLVPLHIVVLALAVVYLAVRFERRPIIVWIVSGLFISYMISIEGSYSEFILLFRSLLLIGIVALAAVTVTFFLRPVPWRLTRAATSTRALRSEGRA